MSRFCIAVCFLALVVVVHSRHYVRLSYEELNGDEEKSSFPMMELMKPSNVLRFQQALRLTSFHWDNCGEPSKAMTISSLLVSPDPIQEGAAVHVSVQGTMDETVSSPIEADVELDYKSVVGWFHVPCSHEVGSCNYPDICTRLPSGTCPINKGKFNLDKSFAVPTSPPAGDYRVTVNFKSQGAWLACVRIAASIS